jgi:hypothetical protein
MHRSSLENRYFFKKNHDVSSFYCIVLWIIYMNSWRNSLDCNLSWIIVFCDTYVALRFWSPGIRPSLGQFLGPPLVSPTPYALRQARDRTELGADAAQPCTSSEVSSPAVHESLQSFSSRWKASSSLLLPLALCVCGVLTVIVELAGSCRPPSRSPTSPPCHLCPHKVLAWVLHHLLFLPRSRRTTPCSCCSLAVGLQNLLWQAAIDTIVDAP